MTDPNFILLHVADPAASVRFYSPLLGKEPIESSPNFAMFALDSGVMLGLWAAHDVQPAATASGGFELAFAVADNRAVASLHRDWQGRGLTIIQPPTAADFGLNFVATDPDGHRLRVFAPSGE